MQVGPLAQMLVGYASGHARDPQAGSTTLPRPARPSPKTKLGARRAPLDARPALAARACARAVHRRARPEALGLLVENIGKGDTAIFNRPSSRRASMRGFGFHEAPRGTLSHWVVIEDGKIANYQAVVPSTWNAGPRDAKGQPGAYEASLVGNPVADAEHPLEALRTIHSSTRASPAPSTPWTPPGSARDRARCMTDGFFARSAAE